MTGGWGTPTWQGGEVGLGEVFVSDKSQQMARDLLQAAADLGLDPGAEVRTVTKGFIVPEAVYEQAHSIALARTGEDF
jgi:hypothetical protein